MTDVIIHPFVIVYFSNLISDMNMLNINHPSSDSYRTGSGSGYPQPTTDPEASSGLSATDNRPSTSSGSGIPQPTTDNGQPPFDKLRDRLSATDNRQPPFDKLRDRYSATDNRQPTTDNRQPFQHEKISFPHPNPHLHVPLLLHHQTKRSQH